MVTTPLPSAIESTITMCSARALTVAAFVRWYSHEHRHSGIGYVTPAQLHAGEDHPIFAVRHAHYAQARETNPAMVTPYA
jgi:hypothetical protein